MSPFQSLASRVLMHAVEAPDRPALWTDGGHGRTYGWLAEQVVSRASALKKRGVAPGTRVLMDATRSEDFVVTLLAGWHVGASLVPIATDLPPASEAALLAQLPSFVDVRGAGLADQGDDANGRPQATLGQGVPLTEDDEAYVMFTSGSTGVPKGVRIAHRGLPRLFREQARLFRTTPDSRASWLLAAHFDASISDIGVPLWMGASLGIWSGRSGGASMLDFVESERLTQIDLPPAQLPALLARGVPRALETIIVGGEPAAPHALREAARQVRVVNVYGPTETTVCASAQVIDAENHEDAASLGWPIAGTEFHVLEGELYISGDGVGLGYLDGGRGAFLRLPGGGPRAYRTGDLVEPQPDGSYRFLGRCDRQIQLRGQRLELTEVEAALVACSAVTAAAVVLQEQPAPHLVAFIEGDLGAAQSSAASLQDWKRPTRIEALSLLPRLSNGKVDLAALGALSAKPSQPPHGASPGADALASAWCRVLGIPAATEGDDFFALGGDSVTALELSVEAARAGLAIEPEAVYSAPCLRDLRSAITLGRSVSELRAIAAEEFARLDLAEGTQPPCGEGVLLTGATGMLGLHLLRSGCLGSRPIYALVRGKDQAHSEARLARLLGGDLPAGVEVLRGDLGLDQLGLTDPQIDRLRDTVGEVIHSAGAVDLVRSFESLRPIHVTGTGRVMKVASLLGARMHHVSTLSIFVETDLPSCAIGEELRLDAAQQIFGGYAQSKFVGDVLASRYPLGGSRLRLGLLTADSQASTGRRPLDQLSRVIRGVATLGTWPTAADERALDLTPVDCAARTLAFLVNRDGPSSMEPVHLANSSSATGAMLYEALVAEGLTVARCEAWPTRQASPPRDHADAADRAVALAALTARAHGDARAPGPRSGDLFLASDHRFHCQTLAARTPKSMPPPPTVAILQELVRTAFGHTAQLEAAP